MGWRRTSGTAAAPSSIGLPAVGEKAIKAVDEEVGVHLAEDHRGLDFKDVVVEAVRPGNDAFLLEAFADGVGRQAGGGLGDPVADQLDAEVEALSPGVTDEQMPVAKVQEPPAELGRVSDVERTWGLMLRR